MAKNRKVVIDLAFAKKILSLVSKGLIPGTKALYLTEAPYVNKKLKGKKDRR